MIQFETQLKEMLSEDQLLRDEPMKRHTTFRIGGNASYYVMPSDEGQLSKLIGLCQFHQIPYFVVGNGSNLLVTDKGYRGVIISLQRFFNRCEVVGDQMIAGSGTLLSRIAQRALNSDLAGFEFASGIPGTLGGAIVMNAGAYGSEMKDCLNWVKVVTKDGAVLKLALPDLMLGYRTSCILSSGYIITEASLQLEKGDYEAINARMNELKQQRKTKQPLEYPSAGSTFKRPAGYFAGKLIDDAGLRGYQVGGAQISEKHCGFVINKGDATAADVIELCQAVSEKIKAQFQVELELEIKILGDL